jgi:hypothetical protein
VKTPSVEILEGWAEYFDGVSKARDDFFAGRAESYRQLANLSRLGMELAESTTRARDHYLKKKGGAS